MIYLIMITKITANDPPPPTWPLQHFARQVSKPERADVVLTMTTGVGDDRRNAMQKIKDLFKVDIAEISKKLKSDAMKSWEVKNAYMREPELLICCPHCKNIDKT